MVVTGRMNIQIILIILLLLAAITLYYLSSSTYERFQIYDLNKNITDLNYYISLGLQPEYNDSYRDALAEYKANNGVDYDPTNPQIPISNLNSTFPGTAEVVSKLPENTDNLTSTFPGTSEEVRKIKSPHDNTSIKSKFLQRSPIKSRDYSSNFSNTSDGDIDDSGMSSLYRGGQGGRGRGRGRGERGQGKKTLPPESRDNVNSGMSSLYRGGQGGRGRGERGRGERGQGKKTLPPESRDNVNSGISEINRKLETYLPRYDYAFEKMNTKLEYLYHGLVPPKIVGGEQDAYPSVLINPLPQETPIISEEKLPREQTIFNDIQPPEQRIMPVSPLRMPRKRPIAIEAPPLLPEQPIESPPMPPEQPIESPPMPPEQPIESSSMPPPEQSGEAPIVENFSNRRNNKFVDFTSRFNLTPLEYSPIF